MRGTTILGCFAGLTDGYMAGTKDAMHHHARQQIAADRTCGRDAARVAREERNEAKWARARDDASGWDLPPERPTLDPMSLAAPGDESAEIITDPAEARRIFGRLLDLPDVDAEPTNAEAGADAAWLRQREIMWALHAIVRRRLLIIAAALRLADAAALPEIAPAHQRRAHLTNILAHLARAALTALIRARIRVAHICAIARAIRVGRAAALASAGPVCIC